MWAVLNLVAEITDPLEFVVRVGMADEPDAEQTLHAHLTPRASEGEKQVPPPRDLGQSREPPLGATLVGFRHLDRWGACLAGDLTLVTLGVLWNWVTLGALGVVSVSVVAVGFLFECVSAGCHR